MDFQVFQATHQPTDFADHHSAHPHQRHGQWLMNELGDVRKDIYLKICGTDADCFFVDENIPKFWCAVHDIWYGFSELV